MNVRQIYLISSSEAFFSGVVHTVTRNVSCEHSGNRKAWSIMRASGHHKLHGRVRARRGWVPSFRECRSNAKALAFAHTCAQMMDWSGSRVAHALSSTTLFSMVRSPVNFRDT